MIAITKNPKQIVLTLAVIIVATVLLVPIIKNNLITSDPRYSMSEVSTTINGTTITLWKADSELTRARGLSGLESLPNNRGMLFVFDKSDLWGIWMKEMRFPIDIIWLDENFSVVHIEKNADPKTYPSVFFPKKRSLYVIELPKNDSDRLKIILGKTITVK